MCYRMIMEYFLYQKVNIPIKQKIWLQCKFRTLTSWSIMYYTVGDGVLLSGEDICEVHSTWAEVLVMTGHSL